MQADALSGGFENASIQSAKAFRGIMNALARPGTIERLEGATPPKGMSAAAGTLILTLCDQTTPVHLTASYDTPLLRDWITFQTNAPLASPKEATFALGGWDSLMPITQFGIGTAQYPDRSTSLIVEVPTLSNTGPNLFGPGIKTKAKLSLPAIEPFQSNAALFPLGCDFYFTSGDYIAALPRTTKVEDTQCT